MEGLGRGGRKDDKPSGRIVNLDAFLYQLTALPPFNDLRLVLSGDYKDATTVPSDFLNASLDEKY